MEGIVDDIILETAPAILVLESPHTDEVRAGFPLAGAAGTVVSRVLLNHDEPIGKLCHQRRVNLSLLNTFQQPRQSGAGNVLRPPLLKQIDEMPRLDSVRDAKDRIKEILDGAQNDPLIRSYHDRMKTALETSSRLVICGVIAQAVFEWTFQVNTTWSPQPVGCRVDGRSVRVFYVWHPSPNSGTDGSAWLEPANARRMDVLKAFIGPLSVRDA